MSKRYFKLKFCCRQCGFNFRRKLQNPRAYLHSSPRCPSCSARDCDEDYRNATVRQRAGYMKIYDPKKGRQRRKVSLWAEMYNAYLKTPEWRRLRAVVIERDGQCCRACKATEALHVHHLHYRTLGRESGSELVTFCKRCHLLEHGSGSLREKERFWISEPVQCGMVEGGPSGTTMDSLLKPVGTAPNTKAVVQS